MRIFSKGKEQLRENGDVINFNPNTLREKKCFFVDEEAKNEKEK